MNRPKISTRQTGKLTNRPASEKLGLGYHLIPWEAVRRLGKIFEDGQRKYKDGAVCAANIERALDDQEWQAERLNHAVDHLGKWMSGDRTEDHLAKVMWFCSVQIEIERLKAASE